MKKIFVFSILLILGFCLFYSNINIKKTDNLVFSSWGSQSEIEILKKVLSDFEKENKINVDFLHIPQNYFQKLHLLFASKLEPDVIFINNHYIKMYSKAGLLEDLSPFFKEEINSFFDVAINCFKEDEKIYAIPRDLSNLVLYVNKDLFKKNNIQYMRKINSLTELKEIATKLSSNENWGINFEDNNIFWLYYLSANGGGILSDDCTSFLFNSKESIEGLKLYTELANKDHVAPNKAEIGSMTTAQMFMNGKIAMYLSGRWLTPIFKENIQFDWDIIEFPSSENNKVYVDSSGWAISKNSKKKDKAIKLIKYLSSIKANEEFTKSALIVPARIDVAKKYFKYSSSSKPNNEDIFVEMLKYTKPTPVNENYQKINDILKEDIQNVFSGIKPVEDIQYKKLAKRIERLL